MRKPYSSFIFFVIKIKKSMKKTQNLVIAQRPLRLCATTFGSKGVRIFEGKFDAYGGEGIETKCRTLKKGNSRSIE
jgi:hypothetical protein